MVTAKKVMDIALSYLGTKEQPANSNNVIFNTHYYGKPVSGSSYAWCCAFVWDCFRMAGASNLFYDGNRTAYCPTIQSWAKKKGLVIEKSNAKYGDVAMLDWNGGLSDHIGFILENLGDGRFKTVEGNTGSGSNANGGEVQVRTRYASEICQVWRPEYDSYSIDYKAHVQSIGWQDWVKDGEVAGTTGKSKRLEAITINPNGVKLKARVHLQGTGWTDWVEFNSPATLGTTGKAKRLEAIEIISLTDGVEVEYQAHMQTYGWGTVYRNGKTSNGYTGTVGQAKRIEALRIRLV